MDNAPVGKSTKSWNRFSQEGDHVVRISYIDLQGKRNESDPNLIKPKQLKPKKIQHNQNPIEPKTENKETKNQYPKQKNKQAQNNS